MKLFDMIKRFFLFKEENDAHEFKPVLAEIEESPVNPLGKTVFWTIIIFMLIASLWMYFGKVDVVITARGMIIPDGEEKLVQSLEKGVVTEVKVKEGDYVEKGQVVAIVSPAEYEPGLELNNLDEEEHMLHEQIAQIRTRLSYAREKQSRLSAVRDIIPSAQYDENAENIKVLSHEAQRLNASLVAIRNKRVQIQKQKQILVSPVDGYIGQIFVHTIGGVVTPAEKLMSVVPKDAKLKIKAKVLNQDIGFVQNNMPVSIKIDTYNFQKYGLLNGEVISISPNSIEDEKMGPVYEVYIKILNTTLMVEGKEETIKTGMTTTNEIKIGKRRIIEFFIYPLIKYLDESIKVQ